MVLFNGTNAEDRVDPTRVGLVAAEHFAVSSPIDALTKDEVRTVARHLGLPNWRHAASPCLRSRLALGVAATDEALRRVEQAEDAVRAILAGGNWSPSPSGYSSGSEGGEGLFLGGGTTSSSTSSTGTNLSDADGGESGKSPLRSHHHHHHLPLLDVHHNLRVRSLARRKAVVEVDEELLETAALRHAAFVRALVGDGDSDDTGSGGGLGFQSVEIRPFRSGSVSIKPRRA